MQDVTNFEKFFWGWPIACSNCSKGEIATPRQPMATGLIRTHARAERVVIVYLLHERVYCYIIDLNAFLSP